MHEGRGQAHIYALLVLEELDTWPEGTRDRQWVRRASAAGAMLASALVSAVVEPQKSAHVLCSQVEGLCGI